MISNTIETPLMIFGCWLLMGVGMAGIGLSIMHDANHGSYSKYKSVNRILGYLLNFVGGSVANWKIQHNTLHHSYTNIEGLDEDIGSNILLRFSPHYKRYKIHRWQHYYAWAFYSIMTLYWLLLKDYLQLYRYKQNGMLQKHDKSYNKLMIELILSKLIYAIYILAIPLALTGVSWWMTLLFFLSMQMICGFILSVIFQCAHVMPSSKYPLPDKTGGLENSWAVHQLLTTTNFSPRSKIFSWFIGGLNYQIEHHLFPNICHVHYKKISSITRKTASEFGIPYNIQPNFVAALWNHLKMLRDLGRYRLASQ
jgi:linoleoyl-CoA desaturase